MNIYLIGFMGCGKSTVGKELARKLNMKFTDLDVQIEAALKKTVDQVFRQDGEAAFRLAESKLLQSTCSEKNVVVATGGGTPCFHDNLKYMNQTGITVYIQMHSASLYRRLSMSKKKRPLLEGLTDAELMEFILSKTAEREPVYLKSHLVFKGENLDCSLLAKQILEFKNPLLQSGIPATR